MVPASISCNSLGIGEIGTPCDDTTKDVPTSITLEVIHSSVQQSKISTLLDVNYFLKCQYFFFLMLYLRMLLFLHYNMIVWLFPYLTILCVPCAVLADVFNNQHGSTVGMLVCFIFIYSIIHYQMHSNYFYLIIFITSYVDVAVVVMYVVRFIMKNISL